MMRGTGETMHTIPASIMQTSNAEDGKAISVPGGPPKWAPLPLPVTLSTDCHHQIMDQATIQVPIHPFEPVFQATSVMNPDIRLDEFDIIDPFRMDLNMVKETLFICHKEQNNRSLVYGPHNSGYGHSFENAFTKTEEELETSGSHHRVDAYCEGSDNSNSVVTSAQSLDDAANLMERLDLKQTPPHSTIKGVTMAIRREPPVSLSKLAEIKVGKSAGVSASIPQRWFGRTPHLLIGKHDTAANQDKLRKLVSLLIKLKCIVGKIEGRAAIQLCKHRAEPLQIFKAKNETNALPEAIVVKHWDLRAFKENQE
ncbi:hypothetical protein K458DRAFT_444428 [Lentithecium fluviatile CBS 122367]|uniref:Uncharacterized protein n=1 Tax=Lentithecium fluviatile CBS 122367 TaxID=1168545 RepID=A0A6G1IV02_9PLEO|nr:hypothetical protein K458DRAFT_444428 [Lentithecium fluviatile CBS 122367]